MLFRRVIFSAASAVTLLAALGSPLACSNEGEGQPCSLANGSADCNSNLVCIQTPNPSATDAPDVCCPPAGQGASTPECSLSGHIDAGDASPPDASTFPDTSIPGTDASEAQAPEGSADGSAGSDGTTSSDGATADGASGDGASANDDASTGDSAIDDGPAGDGPG